MRLTATAAVSITTISNGYNGQLLMLLFTDSNVTLVHDASGTTNTINLNGVNITGSANTFIQLSHNGTSWVAIKIAAGAAGVTSHWIEPKAFASTGGGAISTGTSTNFARIQFDIVVGAANGGVFSFRLPSLFTAINAVSLYYLQEAAAPTFDVYTCFSADGEDIFSADTDQATGFTCASGAANIVRTIAITTAFDGNAYTAGDLVSVHIKNIGVGTLEVLGVRIDFI